MDKELVKKDIETLRENKNCAQSTLIGLCRNGECDISEEELAILASGFGGGIGGTFSEGTCGALTGAVMALGLLEKDGPTISSHAKELFEKFEKEYTSVTCGVISKNGEDKSPCVECCVYAGEIVADLLK
ncbi:MAG: C-GCAxxG-C-C family protein [Methanobrevibacter sp.]|uniref:C-GCAxxG-C-C family protein n=1 Tax=Methanobrevibacter sp. TaxID=66852 RepID=UPI0026DF9DF2|nr:C-GCAxxG-C-C family protein [Methanobrevibacter sp.]MDO5847974.1 C-GCAxxG-C-C family protein [Methanobrevibacter sp.]